MQNDSGVGGSTLKDFAVFQLKVFRGTIFDMQEYAQVVADQRLLNVYASEKANRNLTETQLKEAVFEHFTNDFPLTFKSYMVAGGSPQVLIYTMHTASGKGADIGPSAKLGLNLCEFEHIQVFPRDELIASLVSEPKKPNLYLVVDNTGDKECQALTV